MRIKVSNYIAKKLLEAGITDVFMITGGGACIWMMPGTPGRAELYFQSPRAGLCHGGRGLCESARQDCRRLCDHGAGGINAMTGVAGGYLDSIPMFIVSGQVRYDTMSRSTGLHLRAMGDQEFDITRSVANMTKYTEMIIDPMRIRFCMEKALYLAYAGRPGPVWLDVPLNVQAAEVETDDW